MFIADLHVHSKYSRACSKDCDIEHLCASALRKGLTVLGTGDFTHPAWAAELKETLVPAEPACSGSGRSWNGRVARFPALVRRDDPVHAVRRNLDDL